ncbi:PKD domain-containing protein [bacterium]|nr:PKD domain-containing protein [bacterium]
MFLKLLLPAILAMLLAGSCAGPGLTGNAEQTGPRSAVVESGILGAEFPIQLPLDMLQPWEDSARQASGPGPAGEFVPGREWFLASGAGVTEKGEAANLTSTAGEICYGIYRVPLGGAQPGSLSTDINLLADGMVLPSSYYLGLANYGSGRWEWHGPFSDGHVTLSYGAHIAAGGNFLSPVQNAFVCVLLRDGSAIDLVGLGLDAYDAGDSTGPAAPIGVVATPVAGGLELSWNAVAEADLAGYRVSYSDRSFISPDSAGVLDTGMLEGSTRYLLSGLQGKIYVRLSSVDSSGNSGPASEMVSAVPLAGEAPSVMLITDLVSGGIGSPAILGASGADTYDFDTDGDGIFEVTGNTSGTVAADTSRTGIIRPRVRGSSDDGTAVALGAVSLLITGNSRPVAYATATPTSGDTPLEVSFSGAESVDFDGSIVGGGWDFDGDGVFNVWDDTDKLHVISADATFTKPGVYNAKLRVVDDHGAWDADTVTIIVGGNDPGNFKPTAVLAADTTGGTVPLLVNFDAGGSSDSDGTIVNYEWDYNGDGQYDSYGSDSTASHTYASAGNFPCQVRVTDNSGGQHSTTFDITARLGIWQVTTVDPGPDRGRYPSLVVVDGQPAISYYDGGNTNLMYVRAEDVNGQAWGSPMTIDNVFSVGEFTSMAVVQGHPAISYYADVQQDLKYIRALDPQGMSWGSFVRVDTDGDVGIETSLLVVDGMPAIAYYDATAQDLKYARAMDATGASWGSPILLATSGDTGRQPSMAIVNGNPAISFIDMDGPSLSYVRASDAAGSSWALPVLADSSTTTGWYSSLVVVNGRPAISYNKENIASEFFIRANDQDGAGWGTPALISKGATTGAHGAMLLLDGRPVVCYRKSGLSYTVALDGNGVEWSDPIVIDGATSGDVDNSIALVNGSPAIAYHDIVNGTLLYARLY